MKGDRCSGGRGVLVIACLLTGCANEGFGVDVTAQFDGMVADADLAQINTLTFTITGDETETYPVGLGRAAYRTERVRYRPLPTTRALVFSVAAASADGTILAQGSSGTVTLSAGKTSDATVTLLPAGEMTDMAHVDLIGADLWGVSCADATQDGDETGIDCGGSCPAKCVGAMCAADGECVTGTCDVVCVPASGPPSWVTGPSLNTARGYTQAARAADGTIFVVGGTSTGALGTGAIATTERLDWSGAFAAGPSLMTAREGLAVAADKSGGIYAVGGHDVNGMGLLSGEVLLPGALAWSPIQPTIGGHSFMGMSVLDAQRLIVADASPSEIYTLSSNSWVNAGAQAVLRDQQGMALGSDAQVYQVGGKDTTSTSVANVDQFDAATNAWIARAPLSHARRGLGATAAPDGRIYATGGYSTVTTAFVEAYLPKANRWTSNVNQLPAARAGHAASLGPDGRVYVIAGLDPSNVPLATSVIYGPILAPATAAGAPGTMITMTLSNFAASANGAVSFDGTVVQTFKTSAAGTANVAFVVPAAATSGAHVLTALDSRSQYPVTAAFTVP